MIYPHVVEIGRARVEVLKIIRGEIKQAIEEHLHGRQAQSRLRCRRTDGEDDRGWRRDVLRSLLEMLRAEGIWPLPSADELTASPRSLVEIFRVNPNIPAFVHRHDDDRSCDADGTFWAHVEGVLHEVRFTLPVATARHLREQAVKSGLTSYFKSRDVGIRPDKGCWSLRDILEFQRAMSQCGCVADEDQPRWI